MTVSYYTTLYFGKLPQYSDFVRYNASSGEVRSFDQWIQEGMYFSQKHLDQEWNSAYDSFSTYYFLFYPEEGEQFMVGTLHSSRDSSQRKFPFIISLKLEKNNANERLIALSPVVFSHFFQQSSRLLHRAGEGMEMQAMTEQTESLGEITPLDWDFNQQNFQKFLESTRCDKFWINLLGFFDDPGKFLLMKNLVDILLPLRKHNPAHLAFGLRFPLGANISVMPLIICFWIRMCLRILEKESLVLNYFWKRPNSYKDNYLYLFFQKPSSQVFLQLVQPTVPSDLIFRLEEEGKENWIKDGENIPTEIRSLLEKKELTLNFLLDGLSVLG